MIDSLLATLLRKKKRSCQAFSQKGLWCSWKASQYKRAQILQSVQEEELQPLHGISEGGRLTSFTCLLHRLPKGKCHFWWLECKSYLHSPGLGHWWVESLGFRTGRILGCVLLCQQHRESFCFVLYCFNQQAPLIKIVSGKTFSHNWLAIPITL